MFGERDEKDIVFELRSEQKLRTYFLRNIWIYVIGFILMGAVLINKEMILSNIVSDVPGYITLILIVLFVVVSIIYFGVAASSYKRNSSKVCKFYKNGLVYTNPWGEKLEKDITYENVNEVKVDRNILDIVFKTATIRILKAVEYDEGMKISIVGNYKDKVQRINDIVYNR